MSAPISDVVDATLTAQSLTIQQVGFGVGLVLATHKLWNDRERDYGSTSEMSADGFISSDEAYKAAAKYFGVSPAPKTVKVGRRSVDVCKFVPTAVNGFTYSIVINAHTYSYLSDGSATLTEIINGLVAAIGSSEAGVTPSNEGNAKLVLTGTTDLAYSIGALSANLVRDALVASATIATDLDKIVLENKNFYGVILTDRDSASAQAAAAWVSSNARVLACQTQESDVINVASVSDSTTLPAILKASGYDRACCIYLATANTTYPDAALLGRALALVPGSYTLDMKDLPGVAVSVLTSTQRKNALDKNCNVYEERGGENQINDGRMASGKFFDQIHGRDWLLNEVMVDVFAAISAPLKVPYTDIGIGMVEQAMRQAGALGISRGYLESYTSSVPKKADVSPTDRGNRLLPDVKMTVIEAGAIHKTQINITVQV